MSKINTSNDNHASNITFPLFNRLNKMKPLLAMLKGVSTIFANDLVLLTIRVAVISLHR